MKQTELVKKINQASLANDKSALAELHKAEINKILNRKKKGKTFSAKWIVVQF